jgi:hypothetical protein
MFGRPHLNGKKLGVVACSSHPSDSGKIKIGRSRSRMAWAKKVDSIFKISRAKKFGRV